MHKFFTFSSKHNKDYEKIINCKYYHIDEIQTLNKFTNAAALSLFSICSYCIPKNIEDHEYLINKTKIDFNFIGSSKSRIMENRSVNK